MTSNYQGIFAKMFRRTNSASSSARPTAHPSSDSLNLLRLIRLSPFDFQKLGTRPPAVPMARSLVSDLVKLVTDN